MVSLREAHKPTSDEGGFTLFPYSVHWSLPVSSSGHPRTGENTHPQPERGWFIQENHAFHKEMEGGIMKKELHHLMVRDGVYYLQANGQKKSLRTRNKEEAKRRRDELLRQMFINGGRLPEPEPEVPVFGQVASEWYERKKKGCRYWTLNNYKSKLNAHLLKAPFVNKPINEITDDDIEAWLYDKAAAMDTTFLMTIVSMVFKFALKKRYITQNPALLVQRPPVMKKLPDPFTQEEMNKIILGIDPHYQDYIEFKFLTGMSSAEVHGLKKENLDFESGLIHITQANVNGIEGQPKNAFRMRSIEMNSRVYEILLRQISKHSSPYVFVNKHGNPIHSNHFARVIWKKLLKKLDIRYRRAYNTRHTFISMALKAGEAVDYVAKFVGHCNTQMIYERYQAYIPDKNDGRKFEAFITSNLPQKAEVGKPTFSMSQYLLDKITARNQMP